ncbi:hypothetical protein FIBSPDRAFT_935464 [Athelia psychrophila]|uniref:Uncharacterized protein n=1 Tax=Athelia psychrophila TaxID=1759441 RepID=A0A166DPF6_9AGAM|nr:hypothetical protein FIBSPDRAFT_935464 [Fibularhizoctonia sp. CBS 109695]
MEIDFLQGIGATLIDVQVTISAYFNADKEFVEPSAKQIGKDLGEGNEKFRPVGFAATVQAAAAGLGEAVDANQVAEDLSHILVDKVVEVYSMLTWIVPAKNAP